MRWTVRISGINGTRRIYQYRELTQVYLAVFEWIFAAGLEADWKNDELVVLKAADGSIVWVIDIVSADSLNGELGHA